MVSDFLSFSLPEKFLEVYKDRKVNFGYPIGMGNSIGEITFLTKYSRRKEDGTKEKWWEVCRRCIEGMYSIQKDECFSHRTPWNEIRAQKSAQEAFERMFTFKWLPAGRGLWMMGTEFVHKNKNSAALQSCAFLSTGNISNRSVAEAIFPFIRNMEMSMFGIGVGFDVEGVGKLTFHQPKWKTTVYKIADSREGWCESVGLQLESYFFEGRNRVEFDYSLVRPAGESIKGFGGISAGPGPLMDLHSRLDKLLCNRDGESITETDIADIQNLIGKSIVSGNVRRTAQIMFGDANSEEYINLKNWELNPERMGNDGWGNLSNNSVFANVGGNYDHLIPNIISNGEPGFFYRDIARNYGRLVDPPNGKDWRVAAANPCFLGNTKLLTKEYGLAEIGWLANKNFTLWNGQEWSESTAWHSGVKPVYDLTLTNGQRISLTGNHKLAVWTDGDSRGRGSVEIEMTVDDIQNYIAQNGKGPKIKALLGDGNWEGDGPEGDQAILLGYLLGDGSFQKDSQAIFTLNQEPEVLNFLRNVNEDWKIVDPIDGVAQTSTLFGARKICEEWEFDLSNSLPFRALPKSVFTWNSNSIKLMLKGLFSANGTAKSKHNRISLKTTCIELAQQVQDLLIALGYSTYITTNKSSEIEWSNGTYISKESYEVNIGNLDGYRKFQSEIGFLHNHKSVSSNKILAQKKGITSSRVKSITYRGVEDVYDFNEPSLHWGWANGFKSHNCMEQSLENNELCCLVETFISNHDNYEDYEKTLKFAYLYGKSVTLLPTHWPETNEVMHRNRRIGCSISGIVQFIEDKGWTELRTWMNKGYEHIQQRDKQYSEWLGIRESIKTTSIKPSGTVSLLAGVTPGVHWPVADTYIRRMRLANNDPMLTKLQSAGYHTESDVMHPKTTMVVSLPTKGPKVRTEREVSVWEKIQLAIVAQRYWADNQVSVTLTFKPEEAELLGPMLHATEGQLKGFSLLPLIDVGGVYQQMPYQRISDEEYKEMIKDIKPIDFESLYAGEALDPEGEKFCSNESCEIF